MEVRLNKFAGKVYVTLDGGWSTNKRIEYKLCNPNLVYVTYSSPEKFKSFILTDRIQIARHLMKIENEFNIIFNLKED